MNDIDRLRAAANVLAGLHAAFHGTMRIPEFVIANWQHQSALLQAIADATESDLANFGVGAVNDERPLCAALALANAVLRDGRP